LIRTRSIVYPKLDAKAVFVNLSVKFNLLHNNSSLLSIHQLRPKIGYVWRSYWWIYILFFQRKSSQLERRLQPVRKKCQWQKCLSCNFSIRLYVINEVRRIFSTACRR